MTPRIRSQVVAGAVLSLSLLVPAGAAQASGGITPLSPKKGATVPVGTSPTFKMRVRGPGQVWVHVCKSKKRDADGVICSTPDLGRAKKKGGVFQYKPKFFDFPSFWLNTRGTYYWQAYRIDCNADISDCKQESKITKFKVG
jgi:hypothetical protein